MAGRKSAYRAAVLASATAVSVAWAGMQISSSSDATGKDASSAVTQRMVAQDWKVPSRSTQEAALRGSTTVNPLDMLVIGGGATGCGVALDAATRGLHVGLVERDDFAAGTSSRSTKLVHGGKPSLTHLRLM